ncbi:hypothetical protein CHUAL_006275 [Chamberlinius hualienensis]
MKKYFKVSLTLWLLLMIAVIDGNCQTFQYSRGWTNGRKRTETTAMDFKMVQQNQEPFRDFSRFHFISENKRQLLKKKPLYLAI